MNERLEQFAKEAKLDLFKDNSTGYSIIAGTDVHLESYSKLIIEECAKLADLESSWPDETYSDKIRKYFGLDHE